MIQSLYDEVSLSHIKTRLVVKRFPVHKLLMCFQFSVSTRTKSHSLLSKDSAVYQNSSNTFRLTFMPRKLSCTQQVCGALKGLERSHPFFCGFHWFRKYPRIPQNLSWCHLIDVRSVLVAGTLHLFAFASIRQSWR